MKSLLAFITFAAVVAVVSAGDGTWDFNLNSNTKITLGPSSSGLVSGKRTFSSKLDVDVTVPQVVHLTFKITSLSVELDTATYACLPTARITGTFKVSCSALQSAFGITSVTGLSVCTALTAIDSAQSINWSSDSYWDKRAWEVKLSEQFNSVVKAAMVAANTDVTLTLNVDTIFKETISVSLIAKVYAKPAGLLVIDETIDLASKALEKLRGTSQYFLDCQNNKGFKCIAAGAISGVTCSSQCFCDPPQRTEMLVVSPATCPAPAAAGAVVAAAAVGQMFLF